MIAAEQIARAIAASASVYGDDPTAWADARQTTKQRALAPALAALATFSGLSIPTLARMVQVDPGAVMSARARKRGLFATAERAAMRVLSGADMGPEPKPPTRVHKLVTKAQAAREAVAAALPPLFARYPEGVTAKALVQACGLPYQDIVEACAWLDRRGMASWTYRGAQRAGKILTPPDARPTPRRPTAKPAPVREPTMATRYTSPPAPRIAPKPRPVEPPPVVITAPEPIAFTEADFTLPEEADHITGHRSLVQLKARMCHWPEGMPNPVQMYCAAPTGSGEEYCAEHARKMFTGGGPKKPRTPAQLAHDARLSEQARQRLRERRAMA